MTPESPWKRILKIEFWLLLFPPWGLWVLYRDPQISRPTKQRVLLYTVGFAIAFMLAFTMLEIHATQKALNVIGG